MKALIFWLCLVFPAVAQTSLYINFNQSTIEGGATIEGTVASNMPAGPEGIMVLLTAGQGVSLPDRVFIEPGRKAASFPIETSAVQRNLSVQVRAQVGSVVGLNLVHLMPVGEMAARTPPPSGLMTANVNQYSIPNIDYGYGYGYGGYGYGYGGYGYGGYGYGPNVPYGPVHPGRPCPPPRPGGHGHGRDRDDCASQGRQPASGYQLPANWPTQPAYPRTP